MNVATRPLTSKCSDHEDEALSGNLASEKKLEALEEVLVALLLFQLSLGFLKSGQSLSNLIPTSGVLPSNIISLPNANFKAVKKSLRVVGPIGEFEAK